MWGILLPLLIGLAVGYFTPGRQDKSRMFKVGALWALVISLVVALIGWATGRNPLTGAPGGGFLSLFLGFVVSLVIFLLGVWLGDVLEARRRPRAAPRRLG